MSDDLSGAESLFAGVWDGEPFAWPKPEGVSPSEWRRRLRSDAEQLTGGGTTTDRLAAVIFSAIVRGLHPGDERLLNVSAFKKVRRVIWTGITHHDVASGAYTESFLIRYHRLLARNGVLRTWLLSGEPLLDELIARQK